MNWCHAVSPLANIATMAWALILAFLIGYGLSLGLFAGLKAASRWLGPIQITIPDFSRRSE